MTVMNRSSAFVVLASTLWAIAPVHAQVPDSAGGQMNDGSDTAATGNTMGTYEASTTTPRALETPGTGMNDRSGYSWLPYTTRGYVGISGGQAKLDDLPCSPVYRCDDDNNRALKVYTGGMFNDHFGLELGYFHTGRFDRSGGRVRAHGANLSLLAQAPLGDMAAVYAKVGASYAWTKTSAGPLAIGTRTGKESGPGAAYGVGVRLNATRNWAFVLEWEQHELEYAGDDRQNTQLTTLGVQYRF